LVDAPPVDAALLVDAPLLVDPPALVPPPASPAAPRPPGEGLSAVPSAHATSASVNPTR